MSLLMTQGLRIALPTMCRSMQVSTRSSPQPRGSVSSPEAFLKSIGRSSESKLAYESWSEFWNVTGHDLKKARLAVRDRRYVLWAMEKYRQGSDPSEFAYEPKGKKKIRGWGPAVQNGKRIRSRRHH